MIAGLELSVSRSSRRLRNIPLVYSTWTFRKVNILLFISFDLLLNWYNMYRASFILFQNKVGKQRFTKTRTPDETGCLQPVGGTIDHYSKPASCKVQRLTSPSCTFVFNFFMFSSLLSCMFFFAILTVNLIRFISTYAFHQMVNRKLLKHCY